MIYDCFSFFNELDLLEIRLNVLNDVVDRFVIAESAWTHTGKPKNFVFEENKSRFTAFADKIIYIKLTEEPSPPNGLLPNETQWFLENYQRNALVRGLTNAQPDDVIMVSDCDEIPDPKIVRQLPQTNAITHFHPRNYAFYLNLRDHHFFFSGVGTTALKYSRFRDLSTYAGFPYTGYVAKASNPPPTLTQVRHLAPTRRHYCGWHFSYMGGAKAIHQKFNSIADGGTDGADKVPVEKLEKALRETHSVFGPDHPYFPEPLSPRHLPAYLFEHQDKYRQMILETSESEFRNARANRLRTLFGETLKGFKTQYFFPYAASVKYTLLRILFNLMPHKP